MHTALFTSVEIVCLDMKKFVTQQQQLFVTKTENDFVKQVSNECSFVDVRFNEFYSRNSIIWIPKLLSINLSDPFSSNKNLAKEKKPWKNVWSIAKANCMFVHVQATILIAYVLLSLSF
jgi:hypothetical protein